MKLSDLSPNETVKKLNPQLFGPPMGAVVRSIAQSRIKRQEENRQLAQSKRSVDGRIHVCVHIISVRRRILDGDNDVASVKPLRDAIAKSLGIDDGDPRIRWQYGQVETRGEQGTIVKLEKL